MAFTITTKAEDVGAMPNQIEGMFNGAPFYFRARHGSWSLQIKEGHKSVYESIVIRSGAGEQLGKYQELPGWWKPKDALAFCESLLEDLDRQVMTHG